MTKRERLLERVAASWGQPGVYRLSDEERAAVRKGMEAAQRGEFATDDEIGALYNRQRE
jgi:predicted transcriptional regulator